MSKPRCSRKNGIVLDVLVPFVESVRGVRFEGCERFGDVSELFLSGCQNAPKIDHEVHQNCLRSTGDRRLMNRKYNFGRS